MSVTVSVILPTYNRANSLRDACLSVLNQSFTDFELIVVDDCSSQDIETIVKALDDRRVRYIRRSRNGGAGVARNTGLENASGEFVAFQDSDDLWLPRKLERQVVTLRSLPADVGAVTGGKIVYGRDAEFNYGPGMAAYAPDPAGVLRLDEDQLSKILTENRISVQNTLFRRKCLANQVWFDPLARANEDWDFAIRLIQSCKIYEDPEPVVLGFISPDSISSNFRRGLTGRLRILKKNRAVIEAHPRQHAMMLFELGRVLMRAGKPRIGRRFIAQSIRIYPPSFISHAAAAARKVVRKLM